MISDVLYKKKTTLKSIQKYVKKHNYENVIFLITLKCHYIVLIIIYFKYTLNIWSAPQVQYNHTQFFLKRVF